ncbi:amidase [Achromobacter sp. Marseille-Q4962]|uniref:amidase n=1 Tax=Achromobacter sp. Marseille-Q4962 TaxID=2942202 RepID=UPI0020741D36|nr:amidase [Achromobacter sp. Marseille-Q4962]
MPQAHELSAQELLQAYRARTLSPVEATRAVLEHIARWEPGLHATYALDPDAALAAARASEARWMKGEPLSCGGRTLDGVPATIKENIATRGVPVPLGTAATELTPATADAPPAARMREAGAVILGKTTMPDYGMLSSGLSSFHALTRNPWDLSKNPGGSSAGAGAAAAAGYGPLHIGTDIGGSVRLPAAWCGIATLKPSLGRIPIDPPFMGRCAGPMTRSIADAALMMGVLSQPDARDHMSLPYQEFDWLDLERDLKGLRIGLLLEAGCGLPVDPEITAAVQEAARLFEQAGAVVAPMKPWMTPELLDGVDRFWRTRSAVDLAALPEERRARILPFIRAWAESGGGQTGESVFRSYYATQQVRAATVAACAPYDYVISPVAPVVAYNAEWAAPTNDVATTMHHIGFTLPYNMSEQPAASVNCGYTRAGLPIGLQIAGARFDDLGVLRVARAWERMRPAQRPWPAPPAQA